MDARFHWRFWFSEKVGEELDCAESVTDLDPSEFMRRSVLATTLIFERLEDHRKTVVVDSEGNERLIEEILEELEWTAENLALYVGRFRSDTPLGFFIPQERAIDIELTAERLELSMDSFGMLSLLIGRELVTNELAGGTLVLVEPDVDVELMGRIEYRVLEGDQWRYV